MTANVKRKEETWPDEKEKLEFLINQFLFILHAIGEYNLQWNWSWLNYSSKKCLPLRMNSFWLPGKKQSNFFAASCIFFVAFIHGVLSPSSPLHCALSTKFARAVLSKNFFAYTLCSTQSVAAFIRFAADLTSFVDLKKSCWKSSSSSC